MTQQVPLCISKNNKQVTFDPVFSHAAMHMEGTTGLKDLVCEAIQNTDLTYEDIKTEIDLGRVIGTSDVVDIDHYDDLLYGVRKNCEAEGHSPFVRNRKGEPCSLVALHLVQQPDNTYVLSSTWIGSFYGDAVPLPNAPDATDASKDHWNKRAFIYGTQEIVAGTETSICPW